jgi:SAM-dependent methyltransferase
MSTLTSRQDGFGHEIYDHYHGRDAEEIAERDDGYIALSSEVKHYFAEYTDWPQFEKDAIALACGRVLDVGCGAGRVALYLQSRGCDAMGIDNSPLAIRVCKERGLKKARLMPFAAISPSLGTFDTVVMYGNNFGLFGSFARARQLLRRLYRMTSTGARIIAETLDPYQTDIQEHRACHRRNKGRGRMGGQVRIRIRYRCYMTPWMDYLFVSKKELAAILEGTGWRATRFFDADGGRYVAVIEKAREYGLPAGVAVPPLT